MKKALAVVFALLLPTFGASAASRIERSIGGWDIISFTSDDTGNFSHCAALGYYKSGTNMVMSIDSSFRWRMGFHNRSWHLDNIGTSVPIQFWIDNGPRLPAEAKVVGSHLVTVQLANSQTLFEAFKRGLVLTVQVDKERFYFDLSDSSRSLQAALQCTVRNASNATSPPRSPFSSRNVSENRVVDGAFRVEASTFAANLLSAAGVSGFQMIEEVPGELKVFHAIFVAPGMVGGLVVGPDYDVSSATSELLSSASSGCAGRFASVRIPMDADGSHIQTICETSTRGKEETSYFVIRRGKGGVYGFMVMPTRGQTPEDPSDRISELPPPTNPTDLSRKLIEASAAR